MAAQASQGTQQHLPPFIPDTNGIEALNRHLRKAIKTKGHFSSEDAARKLIHLAVEKRHPAMDPRTRAWTMALVALELQFGDPTPEIAA